MTKKSVTSKEEASENTGASSVSPNLTHLLLDMSVSVVLTPRQLPSLEESYESHGEVVIPRDDEETDQWSLQ